MVFLERLVNPTRKKIEIKTEDEITIVCSKLWGEHMRTPHVKVPELSLYWQSISKMVSESTFLQKEVAASISFRILALKQVIENSFSFPRPLEIATVARNHFSGVKEEPATFLSYLSFGLPSSINPYIEGRYNEEIVNTTVGERVNELSDAFTLSSSEISRQLSLTTIMRTCLYTDLLEPVYAQYLSPDFYKSK